MLAETAPDAVYAIGQPHYMYDIWTWCLAQGLNLYIEKPMGLTLHQARSLAYLADKHGCITQVSFQRRTSPIVVALRAECLKRGPITHAVCRFYKHEPHAMTSARDHMMDDGVHAIDTLRYICGGEVTAIHALTRQVGTPDINFYAATLEFDTGATAVLLNSWTSGRRIFALEMHAPGICVETEPEVGGHLYADGDPKGVRYDARDISGGNDLYVYGGFQAKHREFADAIRSKTQPGSNFADAIKTMEVAEKILAMSLLGVRST
jgi:virulence factor